MKKVAILGAGMSGFGAAHQLHSRGIRPVMYDKVPYAGGHTASFKFEPGFTFDIGPHVSFTKNKYIQDLFAESVQGEYETVSYNLNNYWRGHWIKHPAQTNLHGLPEDLLVNIIKDFASVSFGTEREIRNYEDWLLASYGDTFARTFPMEYTAKYWTTDARNLTTGWLGPRMHRPKFEEVLFGALSRESPNVHYITEFRYPKRDGFGAYLSMFIPKPELRLGQKITGIDPKKKILRFGPGKTDSYECLISSIALPDLIPLVDDVPVDVIEAVGKLACSSCVLVNVGIDRHDVSDAHISYFYDRDICFSRLSFPHNMSRNNVPSGASSIQAEVYYSSKYKPMRQTSEDHIEPVIADLRKCGLLRPNDRIIHSNCHVIPYANVIFDHDREKALSTVHGFLNDVGIAYCGRYGCWDYIWTDEAFVSGEAAARKVLEMKD